MRFLADAHISHAIVTFVRNDGHDCTEAAYLPPRFSDFDVLALAVAEQRIVLTADKGFGELVFRDGLAVPGVVLIRMPDGSESDRVEILTRFWPEILLRVLGHFVTVTPVRVRSRPLE